MSDRTKTATMRKMAKGNSAACILAINGGSSSIKFGLYKVDDCFTCQLSGKIERIGLAEARFRTESSGKQPEIVAVNAPNHRIAGAFLIQWLKHQPGFDAIQGIGHRVVHGGDKYTEPQKVNARVRKELHRLKPYDPEHLPAEIDLLELFQQQFSKLPQVACFDTAFHRDLPRVARLFAIPRRFEHKGIRRYGFHGLSFAYLLDQLALLNGGEESQKRVILAHLGNGCSLAAVHSGKSIDTSMGFTPTAGVPMSNRSGDLDPGLLWYLTRTERMTAKQFHYMINHESGLLGISETHSDMRDLLKRESQDVRAKEAVDLFCYQVKKWIGSFAAALGGVDTLVFSGGIGENASVVRARICSGLDFLGVHLDPNRNIANAPLISMDGTSTTVRVIKTNEELMIAKAVCQVLGLEKPVRVSPT
jgi:acetate kinase